MKKCINCEEFKPFSDFHKNKSNKDGYASICKSCISEYHREYYLLNKDKIDKRNKRWYENNKEQHNSKCLKWYYNNIDLCKKNGKLWEQRNKEARRLMNKKADAKKRLSVKFNISTTISRSMHKCLKGKKNGYRWESLAGYTLKELLDHLESKFTKGMSWDNYGYKGWHIDHIIPKMLWEFKSFEDREFKQCWSLCNLQPLWAKDNMNKGSKCTLN